MLSVIASCSVTGWNFARAPALSPPRAAVRMEVSSWYDAGQRLVPEETEEPAAKVVDDADSNQASKMPEAVKIVDATEFDGVIVPTGDFIEPPPEVALLQRYLQLNTVLPTEAPLPDSVVESLITNIEAQWTMLRFNESTILGDWQLVWQRNTKEATKSQKALAPLPQYSNFITDEKGKKVFRNIVQLTKNRVKVVADVEYDPQRDPPNRLASTISSARVEVKLGARFGWAPLRLPLPLKGVGWLDILFLSDDIRVTRGNRGGVFVHLRPSLLTKEAAAEATK